MHRIFFVLLLPLLSCNNLKPADEEFQQKTESDWINYEGRIPINSADNLYIELAIRPAGPGEGYYKLQEYLETPAGTEKLGGFNGRYASFATPAGDIDLHFQNSSYSTGIKRSYRSPDGKRIREEDYRVRDLVLRKDGDFRLLALDNANEPISLETEHNLSKRTSIVFTVEGQFAHVGDSSVFYEMNTHRTWPVSRQGQYMLATKQYHQLANTKNEGIYLKGTGFSVRQVDLRGRQKEALVFKKIISMSSAPVAE